MNSKTGSETFPQTTVICSVQGWFYLLTGAWPLIHPDSFEWVTGAKRDFWLAQTVGALLVVSGAAMISAARAQRITREIILVALGEALVLGLIDIATIRFPRTSFAYLGDAVVEAALILIWCLRLVSRKSVR